MKNKILTILVLFLASFMVVLNVNAEDTTLATEPTSPEATPVASTEPPVTATTETNENENTSDSKWKAPEPVTKTTSDGLIATAAFKEGTNNNITITVTIPADYEAETLVINPDFFGEIAKELKNRVDYVMPGDRYYMSLVIVNNSKYEYNYDEKSFDIFPTEQKEFTRINKDDNTETFNGLYPTDLNQYIRMINNAYKNLGFTTNSQLTDSNIDAKLKATAKINGTGNYAGLSDISTYMLDYYNKAYNKANTKLEQFTNAQIEEMLGGNRSINYNNYTLESDPKIIELHYNYFYNVLVGLTIDGSTMSDNYPKDSGKTTYPTEDNSIGSYMRDDTKGEEVIKEKLGTLTPNTSSSLNNMYMLINGDHTQNPYAGYEFDMEMQLSYTAKKGNVIATYVDQYGKTLADSVTTTGMVGKAYQTNAKEINGYELNKIEGDEKGKYIDGTIHVVYVYEYVLGQGDGEEPKIVPVSNKIPYTGVTEKNNNVIDSSICVSSLGLITILLLKRKKLTK
jgi:hypothetical protein